MTGQEARKDRCRARIDWPKQKAQEGDCNGISDKIRGQPCQKLKAYNPKKENSDKVPLADLGCSVCEDKTTQSDSTLFSISNLLKHYYSSILTQKPAVT